MQISRIACTIDASAFRHLIIPLSHHFPSHHHEWKVSKRARASGSLSLSLAAWRCQGGRGAGVSPVQFDSTARQLGSIFSGTPRRHFLARSRLSVGSIRHDPSTAALPSCPASSLGWWEHFLSPFRADLIRRQILRCCEFPLPPA